MKESDCETKTSKADSDIEEELQDGDNQQSTRTKSSTAGKRGKASSTDGTKNDEASVELVYWEKEK